MNEPPKCALCGEPMPPGEDMFEYHGLSGPCPKPPTPKPVTLQLTTKRDEQRQSVIEVLEEALADAKAGKFNWCVLVADGDNGTARRWSAGANVLNVISALEDAKFEILFRRARETEEGQ